MQINYIVEGGKNNTLKHEKPTGLPLNLTYASFLKATASYYSNSATNLNFIQYISLFIVRCVQIPTSCLLLLNKKKLRQP